MAIRQPYSRVVDVSLTRQDNFATATGFLVALLLQPTSVAGKVDASNRTGVYASLLDVAADFPSGATYNAAAAIFAQNPRPRQIKIGYRNPANSITTELNAIYAADPDFYWLTHTAELRDVADQRALADWAETKSVIVGLDSNDVSTETASAETDLSSTVTMTIASPCVVTWNAHGLLAGDPVVFTTSGALPTGVTAGTTYYVLSPSSNTFTFAATPGGSAVSATGTQSGTHTATSQRFGGSIAEYIESKNYDRSFAFYHTDTSLYPAAALVGYLATRDLDRGNLQTARRGDINSGQAYTSKFKKLRGITALNKTSAVVQAATGFIPGLGLDKAQGHLANVYVNIGGLDMVVEGNVGSGAFIDEVHAGDWIVARTREALLSTLANNDRVPYTNAGVAILTNAIDGVMRRAFATGILASDVGENGEFLPEYEISVDRVENIPSSQRRNRIAPNIRVDFRYAGAFHYVTSSLIMRF